jgi:hypothetical protein
MSTVEPGSDETRIQPSIENCPLVEIEGDEGTYADCVVPLKVSARSES